MIYLTHKIKGGVNVFECKAVEKVSKNGDPYICLEIDLGCGYKKTVFLDKAEKVIVELSLSI